MNNHTWLEKLFAPSSFSHLLFDQYGHVHENVVQLADAALQLHDVIVTRFYVGQSLRHLIPTDPDHLLTNVGK